MKKLTFALAAFASAMPASASAQELAPAVKRKPAAAAPAPQQAARPVSERDYQAALTAAAAQGASGDPALDASLVQVMSRLIAAGQCGQAAGLASRGGHKELASRAQQLCK
jgi:hypothetical protein